MTDVPADARGNGLTAPDWARVGDVPPHAAEAVLEALRDAGIAAYVRSRPANQSFTLELRQYAGRDDDLFVDATALDAAEAVLTTVEAPAPGRPVPPAPVGSDVDEDTWAALVAAYEASPDAPDTDRGASRPPAGPGGSEWADIEARIPPAADVEPVYVEDLDRYVPPPPPPLPETDLLGRLAWLGLLGAPLVFVLALITGTDLAGWPALLLTLAFLSGFAVLVYRMSDGPHEGDGEDDGAVV